MVVVSPQHWRPLAPAPRRPTHSTHSTSGAGACWVGVGSTVHFDLTEHLYRQITAFPSWTMSVPAMEACARFVLERGIDVDALFTDSWRLDEAAHAYELFDHQATGKGVFLPSP